MTCITIIFILIRGLLNYVDIDRTQVYHPEVNVKSLFLRTFLDFCVQPKRVTGEFMVKADFQNADIYAYPA
jgi:hypothetical protein